MIVLLSPEAGRGNHANARAFLGEYFRARGLDVVIREVRTGAEMTGLARQAVCDGEELTFKGGRINLLQVVRIREWLCPFPETVTKIIVTHHPFDLPPGHGGDVVGRARTVMRALGNCGADVFLSGHLHLGHTGDTSVRYRVPGLAALIVQAGTATSTRGRGEANSFNVIRIERPEIAVERLSWHPLERAFVRTSQERFRRAETGWARL